ncbi:LuxR C-terminal-related transcriptional regulator [Dactylosporangium sp. NPDC048998]|uniref:LuxR C-terminal-related transcriptional regulator n=1 Tax=Dactylosporangium sp. NPDC048998 TaxID=3363976 RepID=UPI003717F433
MRSDRDQVGRRIVLAEDGVLLREGLTGLLHRFGHQVVAAVGDTDALQQAVAEHGPDMVITDVRMPPGYTDEGLRAALSVRRVRPGLAVLVLSQYVEQTYAARLLESDGAGLGYLLKDRIGDIEEFAAAVRQVAAGATVVDPEVIRQLLRRRRESSPLERLSPREREVLALMAQGRSNSAIAEALAVSEAAVTKHIGNLFTKLDLPPADTDHRRVLAVLAYLRGG